MKLFERILKRVPLNFDWPTNKPWKGYCNPYNHHECPHSVQKERTAWKETEPPLGDGFQMWDTTWGPTAPISPVFESCEELANWLVDKKIYPTSDTLPSYWSNLEDLNYPITYEAWLDILKN